jgi:hypothetical protein
LLPAPVEPLLLYGSVVQAGKTREGSLEESGRCGVRVAGWGDGVTR